MLNNKSQQKKMQITSLLQDLCFNFHEYQLYQWMYLMERYHQEANGENFGSANPMLQMANFQANVSLSSSATDIEDLYVDDERIKVKVNLPLLGNFNGPLESYYVDYLLNLIRNNDYALIAFLNIFNHQIICLFYRATVSFLPHISYEKYIDFLDSLSYDTESNIDAVNLIAGGCFNKYGVEKFLSNRFKDKHREEKYNISIQENKVHAISAIAMQGVLGKKARLNENILGEMIWLYNYGLHIEIEAFNFADYRKLLPDTDIVKKHMQALKNKLSYPMPVVVRILYKNNMSTKDDISKNNTYKKLGYDSVLGQADFFHQHVY